MAREREGDRNLNDKTSGGLESERERLRSIAPDEEEFDNAEESDEEDLDDEEDPTV